MDIQVGSFPDHLKTSEQYSHLLDLRIWDEGDAEKASDARQVVKKHIRDVEKTRKSFVEPLLEAKRRIDAQAKKIIAPLDGIVRILDSKLISWHKTQETKRIEAERLRREEEHQKLEEAKQVEVAVAMTGDDEAAKEAALIEKRQDRLMNKPIEVKPTTRTMESTTYVQKRWTFEIVDATKIPAAFMVPDEKKIRAHLMANKERAEKDPEFIPGVRCFQKEQIGGR